MESLFLDVRFPENIFPFYQSAVEFFTILQTTKNGSETRMILNDSGRNKYEAHNITLSKTEVRILTSFFNIVKGKGKSFRFKDSLNFEAKGEILNIQENKAQLFKTFKFENIEYKKIINLPIPNSVFVHNMDIILKENEDYNINPVGGVINFNNILNDNFIKADFEFDIEVRFEQDELLFTMDNNGKVIVPHLSLIEVI